MTKTKTIQVGDYAVRLGKRQVSVPGEGLTITKKQLQGLLAKMDAEAFDGIASNSGNYFEIQDVCSDSLSIGCTEITRGQIQTALRAMA